MLPPPLTLYVHFPWCVRKCPYCDFNSHSFQDTFDEAGYFAALKTQLEQVVPHIWGRRIHAIFFGGGTPSLMSVAALDDFLSHARALLGFGAQVEITLEANPGTAEADKFAGFRQAGVNRLSIGVQSFADDKLRALGRIHTARSAHRALEMAHQAGFDNFNIDLMFALPGQTLEQALADVETALAYDPPHLSHYQLTLEPNTPFYRQPPAALPDEALAFAMQQACAERLQVAGLVHYEVSAWAQPGRRCAHNLNYWRYGDYIGLGAGAHGKLTFPQRQEIWRTQMPASPGAYMAAMARGEHGRRWQVSAAERPFEFLLNRLRLFEPFDLADFEGATGLTRSVLVPLLSRWQEKGALVLEGTQVALTEQGRWFINDIVADMLD
ncbi:MAG TPA: radical SAM family heme chaperone HemW [Piscirickettsiaceae bacterium]|nr:radical SAM family heme chaperone HemW [Piscirickettsiaceae bacterium]HIQ39898.1 radical SAM family heme chaperone HemW [Sulfurivirga caldicuralii]